MLSREEAVDYLTRKVGIKDIESKLLDDKVGLMNEIVKSFHSIIPFQNVGLLSLDPRDRRVPSDETIYDDLISMRGGMCITTNTFMLWMLRELGYKAWLTGASVPKVGDDAHTLVIVENVEFEGDIYLIDVGSGYPTFQAIPLNELPKIYRQSFQTYKYVKEGEDQYARYHRKGVEFEKLEAEWSNDGWQKFYDFKLIERQPPFFQVALKPTYTDPENSLFLTSLRVVLYKEEKAVAVKDKNLFVWENGTKVTKTLETLNDMEKALLENFPMLDKKEIKRALVNWEREVEAMNKRKMIEKELN